MYGRTSRVRLACMCADACVCVSSHSSVDAPGCLVGRYDGYTTAAGSMVMHTFTWHRLLLSSCLLSSRLVPHIHIFFNVRESQSARIPSKYMLASSFSKMPFSGKTNLEVWVHFSLLFKRKISLADTFLILSILINLSLSFSFSQVRTI